MTTLHIMSDLHLDCHRDGGQKWMDRLPQTNADILVIAGDVCNGNNGMKRAERILKKTGCKQLIYVLGNHEHYGHKTRLSQPFGYEIDGVKIKCATLWFSDLGTPALRGGMSDFSTCRGLSDWVLDAAKEEREFLMGADVVVTHHLPSYKCVQPPYVGHELNVFYVNEMSLELVNPRMWIHGHGHTAYREKINGTDCISNPLGYPGERSGFNPGLVVTI